MHTDVLTCLCLGGDDLGGLLLSCDGAVARVLLGHGVHVLWEADEFSLNKQHIPWGSGSD